MAKSKNKAKDKAKVEEDKVKSNVVKNMKSKPSDEKKNDLELAIAAVNKKYRAYGGNLVPTLEESGELIISTVSTGSIGLDLALGRGGVAKGRIYEFYGPPSGGKSTLAISIIHQAQKRGLCCLYADIERAVDPVLMDAMGVDRKALYFFNQFVEGEEYVDATETLIKSGAIDVVVFDSITALLPKAENEGDVEDDHYALLARLMSKMCRRFVPYVMQSNTLMIFINQLRDEIGKWGNPEKTTGGNALPFYATGRIRVQGGETKASRIEGDDGKFIGHETTFFTQKNKLAPPFRTTTVNLIYGKGYDIYQETLKIAVDVGIVEQKGAYYSYKEERFGYGKFAALELLRDNDDFYNQIRDDVISAVGLKELYDKNKD